MFKAFTMRDWAIFMQTYGQPIRVGKYPAGATEEDKDTLFRAVANIAGDCAAIIPESMTIEFIESKAQGRVERPLQGARRLARPAGIEGGARPDRDYRRDRRRPRGRPGAPPGPGGHRAADAKALAAILNRDLVRPWIDLEFGPQEKYPRIRIARSEQKDMRLVADVVKSLVPYGLRIARSDINDMIGLPEPDDDAEVLMPPAAPQPPPSSLRDDTSPAGGGGSDGGAEEARQAARGPTGGAASGRPVGGTPTLPNRDAVDAIDDAAEKRAASASDALVDAIRALVFNADSLGEVRDRLLALKPEMPAAELARHLRSALAYAELTGRAEIAHHNS